MGMIENIKDLFRKDKRFDKEMKVKVGSLENGILAGSLISFNNASYLSSWAAKICIGAQQEENYPKRLEHIERVVARGHESTIAHSSIVILLLMDKEMAPKFVEISNALSFLRYKTIAQESDIIAILLGGSIRAYKYFFREVTDLSNPFCSAIKEILYQSAESIFFKDLIADGIMDDRAFKFYPTADLQFVQEVKVVNGEKITEESCYAQLKDPHIVKGKYCDIVYADNPLKIQDIVSQYGFTLRDILRVTSCTLFFHDISRIISQQLTRHLAGISQESQRYVDYSEASFIDPLQYNNKYDKNKKYIVDILGSTYSITSQDLGSLLTTIYPQLLKQGMLKQDSRSFLINNVGTKLLMTFTIADLIHFIKERKAGSAAQPETQAITEDMIFGLTHFDDTEYLFSTVGVDKLIDLIETPVYKAKVEDEFKATDNSIDEVLSEEEI